MHQPMTCPLLVLGMVAYPTWWLASNRLLLYKPFLPPSLQLQVTMAYLSKCLIGRYVTLPSRH